MMEKAVENYISTQDKDLFLQDATAAGLKKPFVEHEFRCALTNHMQKQAGVNNDIAGVKKIINAAISAAAEDFSTCGLVSTLLSDAFDLLKIDQCEELFGYLEDHIELWKSDRYFNSTKNIILRLCNDLLRRLSKSEKNIFCGRILLFLARFFPLSEKSGLNIVGEFNLDNVTTFEEIGDDEVLSAPGEKSQEDNNVRGSAYKKFWSLQDYFRNPGQCYNPDDWKNFTEDAKEVFSIFSSFRLDQPTNNKPAKRSADSMEVDTNSFDFLHSGKYLTKRELFDLELNDPKFRKNVLIQFLILFQYLQTPTKFKTSGQILKDEQLAFIKESTEKVNKLIEETPPEGKKFLETVNHLLKREELWNSWKNDGCPQFEKPKRPDSAMKVETDAPPLKKAKRLSTADIVADAVRKGKIVIGNDALSELWNLNPDNHDACTTKERDFLPQVDAFFADVIRQVDLPLTASNKKAKDGNFIWRALRLLRIRQPQIFQGPSNQLISTLPEYMESLVKKLARETQKEAPAAAPVKAEPVDEQEALEDGGEELKNIEEGTNGSEEDQIPRSSVTMCTNEHMKQLAPRVAVNWKKLATRLNFPSDEVEYIETKYEGLETQAYEMLLLWLDRESEDATAETLVYEIGGSGLDVKLIDIFPSAVNGQ